MRRVTRSPLHKHANRSRVTAYQKHLRAIFEDWLSAVDEKGYSHAGLIEALDQAAVQWFPQAFANGRHQAYPKRRPSPEGQSVLVAKIMANRFYLTNSLGPDMDRRVTAFRLAGETGSLVAALRKSFESRIVQLYGGAIWNVAEAGYRAGVQQARTDLAIRLTGHLLADEGDDEEPGDYELAIALGITLGALLLLIRAGRARRTGGNIQPTPEEGLSGSGPTGGELAQLIPLPGTLEAAGVRVGLAYEAEPDACDPCIENSQGGDGGVYWEPDEPPLPGDDCLGLNNCRCTLSTVIEDIPAEEAA